MTWSLVVTEPEYRKAEAVFDGAADFTVCSVPPDEMLLAERIRTMAAPAVVLGVETYRGPLYAALPAGGILARFGVGHDGVDKIKATAAGLFVTNTPGVLDDAVAEHALALILAAAKDIAEFASKVRAGEWRPHSTLELRGKTLAVIGCGAIGRRLARAARAGLGMRVVGCEVRTELHAALRRSGDFDDVTAELAQAIGQAEVVSLHVPANADTRHLIDARALDAFRPGAILINTARGMIVDEDALYDSLTTGRLGAAALDVFETEPYTPRTPGKDLRALPNVTLTPHIASNTTAACRRMAERALENIRLILTGHPEEADLVASPAQIGQG
ncbi:MAG: hypothetical protein GXP31_04590 [Kiritimatiellaeota bacterium]|nr:hypothetical protein [Kiritimatiellota bacterium]